MRMISKAACVNVLLCQFYLLSTCKYNNIKTINKEISNGPNTQSPLQLFSSIISYKTIEF